MPRSIRRATALDFILHRVTIADKINIFLLLETRHRVRYYFNIHIQRATLRHVVSLTTSFYIFSWRRHCLLCSLTEYFLSSIVTRFTRESAGFLLFPTLQLYHQRLVIDSRFLSLVFVKLFAKLLSLFTAFVILNVNSSENSPRKSIFGHTKRTIVSPFHGKLRARFLLGAGKKSSVERWPRTIGSVREIRIFLAYKCCQRVCMRIVKFARKIQVWTRARAKRTTNTPR